MFSPMPCSCCSVCCQKNGAFGVIENSRRCSFGYDQRVEVFGAGGSIQGVNRAPQNVVLNTGEGINAGELSVSSRVVDAHDERITGISTYILKMGGAILCVPNVGSNLGVPFQPA